MMNTITVVIMVSRRVGHVTLDASARTYCRNLNGFAIALATVLKRYGFFYAGIRISPLTPSPSF